MKVLVTGASSFVGAHFALEAARDHDVIATHYSTPLQLPRISSVRVDLCSSRAQLQLRKLNIDVVVHLACKVKAQKGEKLSPEEQNDAMLEQVIALGKPILYASSTAVHWTKETPYVLSRRRDEERIRACGLPYGFLRPSAPYGPTLISHTPRHKESFHTLVDMIRYSPIVPMISDGQYKRTPIHVRDFARIGLSMLDMGLDGLELDAGGASILSMREIIEMIAQRMDKNPRIVPIPKKVFTWLAHRTKNFEASLIDAIDQDECIDAQPLVFETGVQARSFAQGLSDLLR